MMVEIIGDRVHLSDGRSFSVQSIPDAVVDAIHSLAEQRDWGIVHIENLEARIEADDDSLMRRARLGANN